MGTKNHPKNNFAFEIRFVDDKTVQVFDIAAKNKQEGSGLPTEYDQDEVLRGQLRYSKLLGSTPSTNKLGDIHDDGQPYEHKVLTKRSKNRRSIQRHTFLMGGVGGGGGSDVRLDDYYHNEERDDDDIEDVKPTFIDYNKAYPNKIVAQATSSPPSPTPSIILPPTPSIILPPSPSTNTSPPSPPAIPEQVLLSTSKRTNNTLVSSGNANVEKIHGQQAFVSLNQVSPIIPLEQQSTTASRTLPEQVSAHIPLQQNVPQKAQKQHFYTEDYTSILMIDSQDCDSKRYIQRQESYSSKSEKRSASPERSCCIIS